MAERFANNFETTLAAAIVSTSATTITTAAAAAAVLQSGEFRIIIGSEILKVTGGQAGTSWTVERGIENTTAATHLNGVPVTHILTAESLSLASTRPAWAPSDNGLLAGNFDPGEAGDQIDTLNGEILWSKLWVPQRVTIANLVANLSSPGSGFSSGNYGMLYSSAGTLVAKTAEQSTPWATAGVKSMALTVEGGQSLTLGGPGVYVIAGVMSRATSRPFFKYRLMEAELNLNVSGLAFRSASDSSDGARTVPPASLVAGSQVATFRWVWLGVT